MANPLINSGDAVLVVYIQMMHIMKKATKLRQPSGMVAAKDIK